jgi:hypothetical protein
MNIIRVDNNGPELISSNFWGGGLARAGLYYLTPNAGALRLLVPQSREVEISEMLTAKEVIVTRGTHRQAARPMVEILFDDHTPDPFVLQLSLEQIERGFSDAGDLPCRFLIYTAGPLLAGELTWYYREADLPCLRPLL